MTFCNDLELGQMQLVQFSLLNICFSYFMQDQEAGGCLCTFCCSYLAPWPSAFPTGADTPLPTVVTPLDLPTIQTLASLDPDLGPAGVRCASKALERSVEGLVLGMASVLRDSSAPTATGEIQHIPPQSRQI